MCFFLNIYFRSFCSVKRTVVKGLCEIILNFAPDVLDNNNRLYLKRVTHLVTN